MYVVDLFFQGMKRLRLYFILLMLKPLEFRGPEEYLDMMQ